MAGSLNKVMIIGNLGADPEVRTFQNGNKVCNLRIATSDNWRDKNTGERREKTEWHSVSVFSEGLVKVCEQYLKKGSKVQFRTKTGQLKTGTILDMSVIEARIQLDGENTIHRRRIRLLKEIKPTESVELEEIKGFLNYKLKM